MAELWLLRPREQRSLVADAPPKVTEPACQKPPADLIANGGAADRRVRSSPRQIHRAVPASTCRGEAGDRPGSR